MRVAKEGELYLIIWLKSTAEKDVENVNDESQHGLFIYDKKTSQNLNKHDIKYNISTHPHFISINGSLDYTTTIQKDICHGGPSECGYEFVSSLTNRLVLMKPHVAFQLSHYVTFNRDNDVTAVRDIKEEFLENINTAFILLLKHV